MSTATAELPAESLVVTRAPSLAATTHRYAPVLLAVFVFGIANLISAPYPVGIFHDDGVYLILAKAIASGDGYRYLHLPGAPFATHYPPIYPLLLAAVWKITPNFPGNLSLLLLVNALLLGWLALSLERLGRERFGLSRPVAVAAVLVGTLSLPLLLLSSLLMSEVLFLSLAVPLLAASESAVDDHIRPPYRDLLLGAAGGLLVLVRAQAIALPLAIVLLLLWRRAWRRAALCAAATAVVLLPWQLWVSLHDSVLAPALRGSYGSYLGWFTDGLSQGGVSLVWHTVATNLIEVASLVADRVAPWTPGWQRIIPLAIVCALIGWAVVRLRRRAPVILLFMALYAAVTLVWPYSPWRFVWAIWPLIILLLTEGCIAAISWRPRPAPWLWRVASFALVALVSAGIGRAELATWRAKAWRAPVKEATRQIAPVIQWAANETKPDDVLMADDEPLVYLMTGRHALPPATFTALEYVRPGAAGPDAGRRTLVDLIGRYPVRYVITIVPATCEAARALARGPQPTLREVGALGGWCGAAFEVIRR